MSVQCEVSIKQAAGAPMRIFERWLTLWVALCILAGIRLGQWMPAPFQFLRRLEIARVNIPVGLLIWVMIIPMLMKIDFGALHQVRSHWKGIGVTLFINWAVKPLGEVKEIVGRIWRWVLIGIAVGALFHGFVPAGWVSAHLGGNAWYSVPAAVLLGIPLYSNATGIIPVAEAMLSKGVAIGTTLALMMSVAALSLPEMLILRKVIRWPALALFAGVLAVAFTLGGGGFNLIA
jgi:hypothetical protein